MSRQIALFVDDIYIKKWYPGYIDDNIDANSFDQFIIKSQQQNLVEILGYDLLNKYNTDMVNSGIPDPTGLYTYLFENYIQPCVALWTIYHSYMSIQYRATNKGIVKKISDTSESIEMSELERVLKPIRDEAEFVTGEIFKYISNNTTSFPEYFTVNGVNRTTPKTNVYTSGIVYKDRRAYGSVYCINFRA